MTNGLPESIEENELKDTLSPPMSASRGAGSQRMKDWIHNCSGVENSNQSPLNVADADPSACASVHPTPMGISLPVNSEGVFINDANLDDLPHDPTTLFQQQMCAARTDHTMPVVTSGLNDTALAPSQFDIAHVNPRRFVENCVSNPVQAVPLHVLPSLEPITTLTTVTP